MAIRDLPEVPAYFASDVELNRAGARALSPDPRPAALSPAEVAAGAKTGTTILDVRSAAAFGTAHVPGSLHIGLNGQFASWAGTLVTPARSVILVADGEDDVREATVRLARVGVERMEGFLDGGIAAWERDGLALETLDHLTVADLRERLANDADLQVLDVRRPAEYAAGHVPRAVNLPLDRLPHDHVPLDPAMPAAVVCEGGYRSSAGASVLRRRGFSHLLNVVGGTGAWVKAGYPVEA